MCFCAGASFAASVSLLTIGLISFYKARSLGGRMFAVILLLFAVQQGSEGMVWLSGTHTQLREWSEFFTYIFLIFAFGFWPFWIPLSVGMNEKDALRKKIINGFLLASLPLIGFLLYYLMTYGVYISTQGMYIEYTIPVTGRAVPFQVLIAWYFLVTVGSLIASSNRVLNYFGVVLALSCIASLYVGRAFFISVWCFFAALISAAFLWVVIKRDTKNHPAV